jgi:hypothetical protein
MIAVICSIIGSMVVMMAIIGVPMPRSSVPGDGVGVGRGMP